MCNESDGGELGVRVLYIDHTARIGGGELALANLVRFINLDAIKPIVLLFEDGPLVARLRPDTETHVIQMNSSVGSAQKDRLGWRSIFRVDAVWLTLLQIIKVAHFARTIKADIIHTNSLKADVIGGIAGRIIGVPVIWHVRDRIDVDYLPRSVVYVFRHLCKIIPDFVIANSVATQETLHLNDQRPSAAIGSGVNVDMYKANARRADRVLVSRSGESIPPRLGIVGRISPWKGQHIFLQAAAEILKRHPTATFEVIGSALFDEQKYEDSLHELCKTLQIEKSVMFLGFVEDIPERIARLDILIHASTTGEPYGQVIIEGMAAGKPVVATNGGGVPDIVLDNITGLLVPMGDPLRMAKAAEYLLDNPQLMTTMGHLGRARVLEHFTVKKTAERVEAVYQQMLYASDISGMS